MSLCLSARFFHIIHNKVAYEMNCKDKIFVFESKKKTKKQQKIKGQTHLIFLFVWDKLYGKSR